MHIKGDGGERGVHLFGAQVCLKPFLAQQGSYDPKDV